MNFEYFWPNMVKVWTGYWQDIIFNGLRITLQFAAVAVLMGVLLGTIVAILKMSRSKIVRFLITVYIEVIRGTPILLQLFIFVFALPQVLPALNLTTPQWTAVALSINSSAYVSEIIRSGIQSVDKGQTEAARSLGLSSGQAMLRIILPQAVRNILPTLGNEFIMMIKETSLASTFFIGDLMTKYKTIQGATYIAFETLLIIGLIYLCITYPLSKLVGWLEKKMSDDSGSGKKRIKHATYESGDLEGVGGGGEPNADLKATHTARDVTVRGRLGGFGLKK